MEILFFLVSAQFVEETTNKRYDFLDELECRSKEDALELVEAILKGRAKKEFGTDKGKFTYNFCTKTVYVDGKKVE